MTPEATHRIRSDSRIRPADIVYTIENQHYLVERLRANGRSHPVFCIDGSVAAGKTEFVDELVSLLRREGISKSPTVLDADLALHSRKFRMSDPSFLEHQNDLRVWSRQHLLAGILLRYMHALETGASSIAVPATYVHGETELVRDHRALAVGDALIVEGIYSASKVNREIFARRGLSPLYLVVDAPRQERTTRTRQRSLDWNNDPDIQEARLRDIYDPSWLAHWEEIQKIVPYVIISTDRRFTLMENPLYVAARAPKEDPVVHDLPNAF